MVQVNQRMLEWADLVFVMDDEQVEALGKMFPDHPILPTGGLPEHPGQLPLPRSRSSSPILQERTQPHFERLKR